MNARCSASLENFVQVGQVGNLSKSVVFRTYLGWGQLLLEGRVHDVLKHPFPPIRFIKNSTFGPYKYNQVSQTTKET